MKDTGQIVPEVFNSEWEQRGRLSRGWLIKLASLRFQIPLY